MRGVQVLVLALAALNVGMAMAQADAMTWRTHRWGPQLRVMACGLMACGCGWLGWASMDLEFAVCGQFGVLAVLLHCSERLRVAPLADWRESRLQEIQTRGDHAQ